MERVLLTTFRLDHDAVALEHAFEELPDLLVEAERIAAHSARSSMPCLWVDGEPDRIEDVFLRDTTVDSIVTLSQFGSECYCHLRWTQEVRDRIEVYIDHAGAVLRASASRDGWKLQFRFATREQFDVFREAIREDGYHFELLQLEEPTERHETTGPLTPAQHEALVTAVEMGYFTIPRTASTRDVAEELGTSHQSVSELLRRGTDNLVRSTLQTAPGGTFPPEHDGRSQS